MKGIAEVVGQSTATKHTSKPRISGGAKQVLSILEKRTREVMNLSVQVSKQKDRIQTLEFRVIEKNAIIDGLKAQLKSYETSGALPCGTARMVNG